MATEIWVNIGSGNGLLPDGTKPLPEPILTDHQWSPVTFILGQFQKRCLNHQSLKSISKLHTHVSKNSNFPGANELTHCGLDDAYISAIISSLWLVFFLISSHHLMQNNHQLEFYQHILMSICSQISIQGSVFINVVCKILSISSHLANWQGLSPSRCWSRCGY